MLNLSMYEPPDYVLNVGQGHGDQGGRMDRGALSSTETGQFAACRLLLVAACSLPGEETTFTGAE